MNLCKHCNQPTQVFVYSYVLEKVVCKNCKYEAGEKTGQRRGIYDATGRLRDRDWLRNKLEITRTEKKWHEDIKSRKVMPDGTVRRIKK